MTGTVVEHGPFALEAVAFLLEVEMVHDMPQPEQPLTAGDQL